MKMRHVAFAFLAICLPVHRYCPAAHASGARQDNPFQRVQQSRLENGLQLYHAHLPQARFYKFTLFVWAGSVDETAGKDEGAAHFVEHLLFQGEDFSENDFDRAIAEMGGSHNAFTHRPFTRYFVYLPRQHLQRGTQLLWRVVFNDRLQRPEAIDEALAANVLSVIDRENQWQDPTWIDQLQRPFSTLAHLRPPGL
jgi:predicted Zn-dependent peptidase